MARCVRPPAARSVGPRSATHATSGRCVARSPGSRRSCRPRIGTRRSVRACIASGFDSSVGLTRAPSDRESSRVDELLAEFALDTLAERPLSSLSYGQARRALIARALVNRPRLLLLDEPWEGLDDAIAATLNAALAAAMAHGTQLVCATHLSAHRELFTHELALEAGRIARAGPRRVRTQLGVAVDAPDFAEVSPVRGRERDACGDVHGDLDGGIPGVVAPERDEPEHGDRAQHRSRRSPSCRALDSRGRSQSRWSARRTTT